MPSMAWRAVPGARSRGLAAQVDRALAWRPALAVVVIGANDLTHLEPVGPAVQALADAVRRLRAASAEVVVAPAPDLSAVPHVPAYLREAVRAAGAVFREQQVQAVLHQGGRVADPDRDPGFRPQRPPCRGEETASGLGERVVRRAVRPGLHEPRPSAVHRADHGCGLAPGVGVDGGAQGARDIGGVPARHVHDGDDDG